MIQEKYLYAFVYLKLLHFSAYYDNIIILIIIHIFFFGEAQNICIKKQYQKD